MGLIYLYLYLYTYIYIYIYIYVFGGKNLTEGGKLEGLHVGGRIILKRTLKEQERQRGQDSFNSEWGHMMRSC